ncbi:MAG: alpha/beta hydrolase [Rhodospirillales bacterium]|nr:alpha/beta hydrolase [Rhodospirillales bacterium]
MTTRAPFRALVLCLILAACAPGVNLPGPPIQAPALTPTAIRTNDGAILPLRVWPSDGTPKAIILALHGFNDYSSFIDAAAKYWSAQGLQVYAYDQRGFGEAPGHGLWPGTNALTDDLGQAVKLLRARHSGTPFYILGLSMGGAVTMASLAGNKKPPADGAILVAPAVWGRSTMPFYQRWALWIAAHTVPWMKLSGRGLNITPSDNIEMLRALGRDPLVIKKTRIDTIWGLVNLMDKALASAPRFDARAMIVYGDNDEVIRKAPTEKMLSALPQSSAANRRLVRYANGYHMLLRDLEGKKVWQDILDWIESGANAP